MSASLKFKLYCALKRAKGSRFGQYYQYLSQHQYLPFTELKAQRNILLAELIRESHRYVPGYKNRLDQSGVYQHGEIHLSRFQEIPPLTREDLVLRSEDFLHKQAHERGFYWFKTGGSTGSPLSVGQDEEYRDWFLANHFFHNAWCGLTLGTSYFFLWSAFPDFQGQLNSWKDRILIGEIQGRNILDCRITSPERYSRFIQIINRNPQNRFLVGYAYQIYALACHSLEYNLPIQRPFLGIYATAENLTDDMREVIETVFHGPVYNRYGCRDAGDLACECTFQNGLHINPMYSLIEIADDDGNPLPYGEEGNILMTSLHNRSMPLIRYAIGDRGVLRGPEKCLCGREWESLVRITGRTSETLYLSNGAEFGGAFLHTAFDHLKQVKRYQIHQISENHLLIKLRTATQDYLAKYQDDLRFLTTRLRQISGTSNLTVDYEQTDLLEKTDSGKELIVVNKMIQRTTLQPLETL